MTTLATRIRRFSRVTIASLSLLVLAFSASLAEGWGDIGGPPIFAPSLVTSSEIVYTDGSVLYPNGTYISNSVTYSVPTAFYDVYGNLHYSEGTILHPDGSWVAGTP